MPWFCRARCGLVLAKLGGSRFVHRSFVGDYDAVLALRGRARHVAKADIRKNLLGIALQGVAETATAGGVLADDVVPPQRNHTTLRQKYRRGEPLVGSSAVDDVGGFAAGVPTKQAPGGHLTPIAEDGELRDRRRDHIVTRDTKSAPVLAGPARVLA